MKQDSAENGAMKVESMNEQSMKQSTSWQSTRRALLRCAIGAAAALTGFSGCSERVVVRPPNVLILMTSQWRGADLGVSGKSPVLTPNLDRLASEGTYFKNAFTAAPTAAASRATLWTGRYPLQHGVVGNYLPLDSSNPSLARLLSARGWRSSYIGTWRLSGYPESNFPPGGPERMGFDEFWAQDLRPNAHYDSVLAVDGAPPRVISEYMPTAQVDLAIERLGRHEMSGTVDPFLMAVSFGAPHPPYDQVPAEFLEQYTDVQLELPPNWEASAEDADGDRAGTLAKLRGYYAACSAVDHEIGRLLEALEEKGMSEDTLVVFLSDHGGQLGEHGLYHAQQPFDESTRIPLIVRYPRKIPAGTESEVMLSIVDVMPSILTLTSVGIPPEVSGRDLSSAFLARIGPEPESVYLQEILGIGPQNIYQTFAWRGVRTRTHLYAEDLGGAWLLYDLERDPHCLDNLIGRRETRKLQTKLYDLLRRWYADLDEQFETPLAHLAELGEEERMREILTEQIAGQVRGRQARVLRSFLAEGTTWTNPRY